MFCCPECKKMLSCYDQGEERKGRTWTHVGSKPSSLVAFLAPTRPAVRSCPSNDERVVIETSRSSKSLLVLPSWTRSLPIVTPNGPFLPTLLKELELAGKLSLDGKRQGVLQELLCIGPHDTSC